MDESKEEKLVRLFKENLDWGMVKAIISAELCPSYLGLNEEESSCNKMTCMECWLKGVEG